MDAPPEQIPQPGRMAKRVTLLILIALTGVMFLFFRDELSLDALSQRESQLRDFKAEHPVAAWGAAFVLYVIVAGVALPGTVPLSLACGWLFGFWPGVLLVSFASTTGGTTSFLISRYLLRDWVQATFGSRLTTVNAAFERDGLLYLFMLRLTPAVPFVVINLLMGLTPLKTRTFWWVSQLGMLPATCIIVTTGAALPNLAQIAERGLGGIFTPQLIVALVLLGTFPLAAKIVLRKWRRM